MLKYDKFSGAIKHVGAIRTKSGITVRVNWQRQPRINLEFISAQISISVTAPDLGQVFVA